MKIIAWKISNKYSFGSIIGAFLAVIFSHFCCWGPTILLPLGLSGASYYMTGFIEKLKPLTTILPLLLLTYGGWKTYGKPRTNPVEKIAFWISAVLILIIIFIG